MNDKTNQLENFIHSFSHTNHTQIHTIYQSLSPVPKMWHIEEGRKNEDQHLLFVRGGSGMYYLNNTPVQLKRGLIVYVSNQYPHSSSTNPNDPVSIIPIRFGIYSKEGKHLPRYFKSPFTFNFIAKDILLYEKKFSELGEIFHRYPDRHSYHNILLQDLLHRIVYEYLNRDKKNMQPMPEKILRYIDQNIYQKLTISRLSSEFKLTPKQLHRIFIRALSISPYQYIIKKKLEVSQYLLLHTDMSIKEISHSLSYPDPYAFSKQFKLHYNISPNTYRKKQKS